MPISELREHKIDKRVLSILDKMPHTPAILINSETSLPYYDYQEDYIMLPHMSEYDTDEEFYASLFHELIHSTSHDNRIGRESAEYDKSMDHKIQEEITAEIGAIMLCEKAGISKVEMDDPSYYIKHWLELYNRNKIYKHDMDVPSNMLNQSYTDAKKAVKHIVSKQRPTADTRMLRQPVPKYATDTNRMQKVKKPPWFNPPKIR